MTEGPSRFARLLDERLDEGSDVYRPTHLRFPADSGASTALAEDESTRILNSMEAQLHELWGIRHPKGKLSGEELRSAVEGILAGQSSIEFGVWVHFPWNRQLVHLLPGPEFFEVRSNRNRYKILPDEQSRLGAAKIGVVGLSVGQTSAIVLAMEGAGGHFRLADFDRLDLSNMNRLVAKV